MKLLWILLVVAASISPQQSSPFVGAKRNPAHDAVAGFDFQNSSNLSGAASTAGSATTGKTQDGRGAGKVQGTVRSQAPRREPVPYALVILFPDPIDLDRPDLIRTARADVLGYFVIENVVPGTYLAIAIMGHGPEDLQAEATIAKAAGTRVKLSAKQTKSLTLYLYPASP